VIFPPIGEMLAGHCVQPDVLRLQVDCAFHSSVRERPGEGGDAG
jgi:hypothetical protein